MEIDFDLASLTDADSLRFACYALQFIALIGEDHPGNAVQNRGNGRFAHPAFTPELAEPIRSYCMARWNLDEFVRESMNFKRSMGRI